MNAMRSFTTMLPEGYPYHLLHDVHADLVRTLGIIAVGAGYNDAWPKHQRVRIEARLTYSTSSSKSVKRWPRCVKAGTRRSKRPLR